MLRGLFAAGLAQTAAPAPIDFGKLLSDGLTTTLFGLGGVFLVLLLFFVIIKGMQRIKE